MRCGTKEAPPTVVNGVPEDCDFNSTTIAQEYAAGDGAEVLEIPIIFHVILNQPPGTGNIAQSTRPPPGGLKRVYASLYRGSRPLRKAFVSPTR